MTILDLLSSDRFKKYNPQEMSRYVMEFNAKLQYVKHKTDGPFPKFQHLFEMVYFKALTDPSAEAFLIKMYLELEALERIRDSSVPTEIV